MKKLKFIGAGVLSVAMAVGISAAIIGSKSLKKSGSLLYTKHNI